MCVSVWVCEQRCCMYDKCVSMKRRVDVLGSSYLIWQTLIKNIMHLIKLYCIVKKFAASKSFQHKRFTYFAHKRRKNIYLEKCKNRIAWKITVPKREFRSNWFRSSAICRDFSAKKKKLFPQFIFWVIKQFRSHEHFDYYLTKWLQFEWLAVNSYWNDVSVVAIKRCIRDVLGIPYIIWASNWVCA